MHRKRKKKSKKKIKNQNLLREKKEINEKTKSRTFFSCHISQHFDKR
jgi:hypothetical protein